jgi:uncharacterized membrane protein
MKLLSFGLVFCSAVIHASWNVAIRQLKGNTAVLVLAHFVGTIIFFPLTFSDLPSYSSLLEPTVQVLLFGSILAHAFYIILLSTAYVYGDVGLIYPLARGTAIVIATLVSQIFSLSKPLERLEVCGIIVVVSGVVGLFLDAWSGRGTKPAYDRLATEDISANSVALDGDIELSESSSLKDATSSELDIVPRGNAVVEDKLMASIGFALCVGACTATYSILDALGVRSVPALQWSFCMNISSTVLLIPFLLAFYKELTLEAMQIHKRVIIMIAPATVGAYLIILYVFSLPDVNIAVVVALREFAVLIGALFGVVLLKERCGMTKFIAIGFIVTGMILIKI